MNNTQKVQDYFSILTFLTPMTGNLLSFEVVKIHSWCKITLARESSVFKAEMTRAGSPYIIWKSSKSYTSCKLSLNHWPKSTVEAVSLEIMSNLCNFFCSIMSIPMNQKKYICHVCINLFLFSLPAGWIIGLTSFKYSGRCYQLEDYKPETVWGKSKHRCSYGGRLVTVI